PDKLAEPEAPPPAAEPEAKPRARLLLEEIAKRILLLEAKLDKADGKLDQLLTKLNELAERGVPMHGAGAGFSLSPERAVTIAASPLSAAVPLASAAPVASVPLVSARPAAGMSI